jgi:hypothetical protein
MNRPNQLDLHPDAESLNAFVEHLLSDEERGELLSHLAACGRCRQVVFLAQEAAGESELEVERPLHSKTEEKQRRNWLASWRPVWVMAAACLAVCAVWLPLQLRHKQAIPAINNLAKVQPATIPDATNSPARRSVQEQIKEQLAERPAAPVESSRRKTESSIAPRPVEAPRGNMSPAKTADRTPQPAQPPPPQIGAATQTVTVQADNLSPSSQPALSESIPPVLALNQPAIEGKNVQPLATPPVHGKVFLRGARTNGVIAGAPQAQKAAPMLPGQSASAAGAAAAMSSNPALDASLAQNAGIDALSAEDAAAARNAMHGVLPSGQTPVSTASLRHRLLAIDNAGALFLSNDDGKSWELVAPPWTGQAVTLRAHPNTSGASSLNTLGKQAADNITPASTTGVASGAAVGVPAARQAPAAIFEIVNDSGSVWTSVDGKTWTAK